jgi:hypothetical protein
MTAIKRRAERGQALLIVLIFVAAFLLVLWAGLSLASSAFLGLGSVQADTRSTYALDAGVAYAMQVIDDKNGNGCNAPKASSLTLNYPSGPVTVGVAIAKGNPCHGNGATWTVVITASGTSRTLKAFITQGATAAAISWEAYQ